MTYNFPLNNFNIPANNLTDTISNNIHFNEANELSTEKKNTTDPHPKRPEGMKNTMEVTKGGTLKDTQPVKNKRQRTSFSKTQLQILEKAFQQKKYLSVEERENLSQLINITESTLQVWFKNRRAKERTKAKKEAVKQQLTTPDSSSFLVSSDYKPYETFSYPPICNIRPDTNEASHNKNYYTDCYTNTFQASPYINDIQYFNPANTPYFCNPFNPNDRRVEEYLPNQGEINDKHTYFYPSSENYCMNVGSLNFERSLDSGQMKIKLETQNYFDSSIQTISTHNTQH